MLILIDGYNLIAPVAAPGSLRRKTAASGGSSDWLRVERTRLIDKLVGGLDERLCRETTVVFDAAGMSKLVMNRLGLERRQVDRGIEIEFAVDYDEADDRIEELIAAHSTPKRLTVVSSDHRIQVAAKRRSAMPVDAEQWLDSLGRKRLILAVAWPPDADRKPAAPDRMIDEKGTVAADDVNAWMVAFGLKPDEKPDETLPKAARADPFPAGYADDLLDEL